MKSPAGRRRRARRRRDKRSREARVAHPKPKTDSAPRKVNSETLGEETRANPANLTGDEPGAGEYPPPENWLSLSAAIPGRSHLARGRPGQDAAAGGTEPRPWLVAADGIGSSDRSEFGSLGATDVIREQLDVLAPLVDEALDANSMRGKELWATAANWIYRALTARQKSLSRSFGGTPADYRFTLAFAALGRRRLGYALVGDAALVVKRNGELSLPQIPYGGEFANETRFVGSSGPLSSILSHGCLPAEGVEGAVGFSDGVSTRALSPDGTRPASALSQILEDASGGTLLREDLFEFLSDPVWDRSTGDDRCIALLAAQKERKCTR